MVRILSWNTLESGEGGAWSNGWGCPLEIQRREELIRAIIADGDYEYEEAKSKAERMLTKDRYRRIRNTVLEEIEQSHSRSKTIDFLMFQECTLGDFWDEPPLDPSNNEDSLDNKFFKRFNSLYQKVPCQAKDEVVTEETVQHLYVRRNSGWAMSSSSIALQSEAFVGGCLAEFTMCQNSIAEPCLDETESPSLILVNLHGKARNMRDPDLRRQSISNLWDEIRSHFRESDASSWKNRMVLCGDWNTQLSDLIESFREVNSDSLLEPVVGMLDNATATTDFPFFSTNHEDGFLAQYDGCLFFGTPPGALGASRSYLELEDTSWNITGFMPKGKDGKLSGDHPGAAAMYNNFTYFRGSNDPNYTDEGVYLNGVFLPGSKPSMGLSDHLRIYTNIHINNDRNKANKDDGSFADKQLLSPVHHQRRPYRHYSEEAEYSPSDADGMNHVIPENGSGSKHLRG